MIAQKNWSMYPISLSYFKISENVQICKLCCGRMFQMQHLKNITASQFANFHIHTDFDVGWGNWVDQFFWVIIRDPAFSLAIS